MLDPDDEDTRGTEPGRYPEKGSARRVLIGEGDLSQNRLSAARRASGGPE
jgi:hypothetical protein